METTWQKNWHASKEYARFKGESAADVVIIGGGISGVTLAYLLSKAGKSVIVLEKGTLRDSSHTAYTTAMITAQVDTNFIDLIKIFGHNSAYNVWQAGVDAINLIEKNIKEENIDCEFLRVPSFVFGNTKKQWNEIKEEGREAQQAGFEVAIGGIEKLKIPNSGYYVFSNQAVFHPLKYCDGLRAAAVAKGAKFFENSEVISLEGSMPVTVFTNEGKVKADYAVVATYYPFNKPQELFIKKGMYLSYMYELSVPKGTLPSGLYLDGDNPYHYFRVDEEVQGRARVILGGEDHRREIKINPEKNFAALRAYSDKIFGPGNYHIENKWRGEILEPIDGLPFIGNYSNKYPNRLIATAFSGNGMTYGTLAGKILSDYILGLNNPYQKLFDPLRKISSRGIIIKARDYTVEFFNGTVRNLFRGV